MPIGGGGVFSGNSTGQTVASGKVLPVADATGVTVDTTTYANPVTGIGTIATLVFPADAPAVAVAITGDAFPRLVLCGDPTNFGALMLGNGTFDAVANGALVRASQAGALVLGSRNDLPVFLLSPPVILTNAAPPDAVLNPGNAALWFDATDGASKLMVKAQSANGTTVTGSINLA